MQLNEINMESSAFIPTPYVIEFAKYVNNLTKIGHNMFIALNAFSSRTTMPNSFEDRPERVKLLFDCFEGIEWSTPNYPP